MGAVTEPVEKLITHLGILWKVASLTSDAGIEDPTLESPKTYLMVCFRYYPFSEWAQGFLERYPAS